MYFTGAILTKTFVAGMMAGMVLLKVATKKVKEYKRKMHERK